MLRTLSTDGRIRRRINGNVRNAGCIQLALPSAVECRVLNRISIQPRPRGRFRRSVRFECRERGGAEPGGAGIPEEDRRKRLYALLLDPVTAAICTPAQAKSLFDEMCAALRDWIPWLG